MFYFQTRVFSQIILHVSETLQGSLKSDASADSTIRRQTKREICEKEVSRPMQRMMGSISSDYGYPAKYKNNYYKINESTCNTYLSVL